MRTGNLILAILMAVSLSWILFAQDQTAVFESDPTSDLPEMMTSADLKSQDEQQLAAPVAPMMPSCIASSQIAPRLIASDRPPGALATVPLVWRLNNPPTAPPAV